MEHVRNPRRSRRRRTDSTLAQDQVVRVVRLRRDVDIARQLLPAIELVEGSAAYLGTGQVTSVSGNAGTTSGVDHATGWVPWATLAAGTTASLAANIAVVGMFDHAGTAISLSPSSAPSRASRTTLVPSGTSRTVQHPSSTLGRWRT
jgi:hypothetical protein